MSFIFEKQNIKDVILIKPKIYIPSGVNESDLQFILEHEKSHIKRKDYLIKPLSFLILSVADTSFNILLTESANSLISSLSSP